MTKIIEYYLNKASYLAVDESGKKITVRIDYLQGKFKVSHRHPKLEKYAEKLLHKKSRVNYVKKLRSAGY
jgi:hypothetical protein